VAVRAAQCEDCDAIVLWECPVCGMPSDRCHEHAPMCQDCESDVCAGCMLGGEVCKGCSFRCEGCEETHAVPDGLSCCKPNCRSAPGPYCMDCAAPGGPGPDIEICSKCGRQACRNCELTMFCEKCEKVGIDTLITHTVLYRTAHFACTDHCCSHLSHSAVSASRF
jgi:hypothetical protein